MGTMTGEVERARFEDDVRVQWERGEFDAAAARVIEVYGAEIFGFLLAVHRDEALASDAFSAFAEAVWRSLPQFEWRSTLRGWAYAVARNVARAMQREAIRRKRRITNLSSGRIEQIAAAVRTQTLAFMRSENRAQLDNLRASLSPDDRALLVLRVDRGLSWNEIARVLGDEEENLEEAELTRVTARLRKRFQLVKEQLREKARAAGLLD
jgi:RNA polymerase sigma-70 factor (ECF subfamily)